MTADPRVEAVSEALWRDDSCGNTRDHYRDLAAVAVAALDAAGGHSPQMLRSLAEDALRTLLSHELDHLWDVKNDEFGRRHTSYQEGYLDGIEAADSTVRGES